MYKAKFNCSNCGEDSTIKIEKGTTVAKFLETDICPNCGCKTLGHDKGEKETDIFKFEKIDPTLPYAPYNKYFYKEFPLKCLFDGLEPDKAYGISCPCPKCSPLSKIS